MNKELIVAGLNKQRNRLAELIKNLESKNKLNSSDHEQYDEITKQVEKDLKKLRQFSGDFFRC